MSVRAGLSALNRRTAWLLALVMLALFAGSIAFIASQAR
jgi:hypothetical protein